MIKTAGKKLCILVLAVILVLLAAGCGVSALMDMMRSGAPDQLAEQQPTMPERSTQKPEPDARKQQPGTPSAKPPAQGPVTGTPQEIYKPIIDAYIEAQSSGFESFDPILGDTFLATGNYSFDVSEDMEFSEFTLFYAFHDMNEDRVPELFIIASDLYTDSIWGVYTIAGNAPRSLLQQASAHEVIDLNLTEDGGSALVHEWSHMGEVTTLFYTLQAGKDRLTLEEGLYTDWNEAAQNEEYWDLENSEIVKYGDHYKGASGLYPDTGELIPISMDEWETVWAHYSAGVFIFPDMRTISDYPS